MSFNPGRAYDPALDDAHQGKLPAQRLPATPAQKQAFAACLQDLLAGYPFLASCSSSDSIPYHIVQTDRFPVAATDGVGVYFNADPEQGFFRKDWNQDNRTFAVAHEVVHILREDVQWCAIYEQQGYVPVPRTATCPDGRLDYKEEIMQRALDGIVNSGLIKDGIGQMPEGCFTHPAITPTMDRGEAYAILYEEAKRQNQNQNQNQNQGQGLGKGQSQDPLGQDVQPPGSMGDAFAEGTGGEDDPAIQPVGKQEALRQLANGKADRQNVISRASSAARQAGHGTSATEEMVTAEHAPGIDWRAIISGMLARSAGNSAYRWDRPSRPPLLRDEPFFAPSRGGHGAEHVVFMGDNSGSIQPHEHKAMLGTVCEMLRDIRPKRMTVGFCDTRVHKVTNYDDQPTEDDVREMVVPKGGGTDLRRIFDYIDEQIDTGQMEVPEIVLIFTDGHTPHYEQPPRYKVGWLVTTKQPVPFGERVEIDLDSL